MHNGVTIYVMRLQAFHGKWPHPLLWAGSWAACGKITLSGVPNRLYYCIIFIVYTKLQVWPRAAQYNLGRRMRPADHGLESH